VLGRQLRIDGDPHEIVGVMPAGFLFGDPDTRVWIPLAFTEQQKSDDARHSNSYQMIGRLRPEATLQLVQTQVDAVNRRNDERFPQYRELLAAAGFRTSVASLRADLTREVGSTLYLLQGGVLLVLLIGCVNIANLVLVRSTVRARELATRFALGAGRLRMVRQLLTESTVLALAGGVLGTAIGFAGVRLITRLAADQLPRSAEIGLHPPVLAATLVLSLFAGLVFGTIPVLRLFRVDLSTVFRQESRGGTAGGAALAARSALVVTQVAVAFALLIGAGLLLVSFGRKLSIDPGFRAEDVVTASFALPVARYPEGAARALFVGRALERIRGVNRVQHAAITSVMPFSGDLNSSVITPEGYVPQPGESPLSPVQSAVTPDYFATMGIPMLSGRDFDARDTGEGPLVVIVDEWLAHRYWPGQDPIGKRMYTGVPGEEDPAYRTIIGVVREIRVADLTEFEQVGHYYFPYAQAPSSQLFLTLRTDRGAATVVNAVRSEFAALDPDLPVYGVMTMRDRIAESLVTDRARMMMIVLFGGVALLLAAVGIYGVLAYSVASRTREIGIRMALGSQRAEIFRLVVSQGLRLLGIGLLIGVTGSLALSRVLRGMLYGIAPNDPLVFAAVLAVLGAVAVVACVLPARRATRVDPVAALTYE
jgi:predicted permease